MKNYWLRKGLFSFLFSLFSVAGWAQAYKTSSNNLVINSALASDAANWSINNSTLNGIGWQWENVLIYGQYLFIDRPGISTASPNLSAAPCANAPKVVRFKYQNANTGKFTFNVKLGGQTIATFKENALYAQSIMTLPAGVSTVSVNRTFLSEGPVSAQSSSYYLDNNIWHVIELYVPNYTSGGTANNLVFENIGQTGQSRQQRIDDAAVFEAIPTPVPKQTSVTLPDCATTTYNLTSLNPTGTVNGVNAANYTYTWYKDAAGTAAVATPTAAPVGTYYLFATPVTACGNNTVTTSYPSVAVTVKENGSCTPVCDQNQVLDGTFSQTDASDSPTGFLVPKGDNANNGGLYWKRNITDRDGQFFITNNTVYGLDHPMTMEARTTAEWDRALYQQNAKICAGSAKTIKFDFVVYGQGGSTLNEGPFQVWLTPSVSNLIQDHPFSASNGVMVSEFYYDGNAYTYNSGSGNVSHTAGKWIVGTVAPGVTLTVNNVNTVVNSTEYNYQTKYSIEITVPASLANAYGGIGFLGDSYVGWLIDNVTVTVSPASALAPSITAATVGCGASYNLTTANPTDTRFSYEWYEDAAGTVKVANPTAVTLGTATSKTFYVKTLNCIGCGNISATPLTLTSNCAFITGKVFADYDGAANGVSNPSSVGQSAGLYAHLVDSTGKVISSVKINPDGTYALNATAAAGNYRVFVNNTQLANNATAPASAVMNPNYVLTQSSTVGSTAYSGTATGYSPAFTLSAGATVSGVNFGVTSNPISADSGSTVCTPGAGNAYTLPALYGVSDDPNFNSGVGQKVTIYAANFSVTNGTLAYNGIAITAGNLPFTIASYSPALLTFTPATGGAASVAFDYTFVTASGAVSTLPGKVQYSFVPQPTVSGTNNVQTANTVQLTGSGNPAYPTAWTSSNTAVATVSQTGLVTGVSPGTATITYTNDGGCTTTFVVTVTPTGVCYRNATTAGTALPTVTGITTLDRVGPATNQWPQIRNGGWVAMESKTKPFVITRMTTAQIGALTPVAGMLVYDTQAKCLKLYNGTSWNCIQQACDQ